MKDQLRALIAKYDELLQDDGDRQYMIEELLDELRALVVPASPYGTGPESEAVRRQLVEDRLPDARP